MPAIDQKKELPAPPRKYYAPQVFEKFHQEMLKQKELFYQEYGEKARYMPDLERAAKNGLVSREVIKGQPCYAVIMQSDGFEGKTCYKYLEFQKFFEDYEKWLFGQSQMEKRSVEGLEQLAKGMEYGKGIEPI